MEWWTAEMTETVVRALLWIVTALLALWKGGAFEAGREWAATLKDSRIAAGALKLINWADSELSGDRGSEKLQKVLTTDLAQKLGIDRKDIEAALAARDAAAGKLLELTSALNSANARIAALEAQLAALAAPLKAITGSVTTTGEPTGDCIPDLAESFGFGGVDGGGGSQ